MALRVALRPSSGRNKQGGRITYGATNISLCSSTGVPGPPRITKRNAYFRARHLGRPGDLCERSGLRRVAPPPGATRLIRVSKFFIAPARQRAGVFFSGVPCRGPTTVVEPCIFVAADYVRRCPDLPCSGGHSPPLQMEKKVKMRLWLCALRFARHRDETSREDALRMARPIFPCVRRLEFRDRRG